ncbi:MAG: hypothetical protein AABY75_00195 [Bacteroidota bacterium]
MHIDRRWSLLIPLFLSGCLEYHTTTTVQSDGGILRSVFMKGDSTDIHQWKYVVPVDSTWTWERSRAGDKEWHLKVEREFPSAEAFNSYQDSLSGPLLRSKVSVDRSFRWFTTRYQYREVFQPIYPFRSVPLTDYLSPAEVDAFLQHEVQKKDYATPGDSLASKDAEDRFEAWARRNEFEAFYTALRKGAERSAERGFTAESLDARKEKLAAAYEAVKDTGDAFSAKDMERRRMAWFKGWKEPVVRRAAEANRDGFAAIAAKAEQSDRILEYPHKATVAMPGVLRHTNARSLEGSAATWENYLVVLYFQEFEMVVESEVTNWWAAIVTAVALVVGPLAVFLQRRRRSLR